jgi:hypothetical protein
MPRLCCGTHPCLDFIWVDIHLVATNPPNKQPVKVMRQNINHKNSLSTLAARLRETERCTEDVLNQAIDCACTRFQNLRARSDFDRKVRSGAFVDAVLTLIELEMPAWSLRRVAIEDGVWFCSLSRQPHLPIEIDDSADASHRNLPMAVLLAFVEARLAATENIGAATTPRLRLQHQSALCCDNFA